MSKVQSSSNIFNYDSGIKTLVGTPTWDVGGTAPSGASTFEYRVMRFGKNTHVWVWLTYATPGVTNTSVDIPWQSEMPLPQEPSARTGTNSVIQIGVGQITGSVSTTPNTAKNATIIKTGTGTYKMNITGASSSARVGDLYLSYASL